MENKWKFSKYDERKIKFVPGDVGELGEGAFGNVILAFIKKIGYVAIKSFLVTGGYQEQCNLLSSIEKELKVLHLSKHENIVHVYGYTKWQNLIGIITDYMPAGNLKCVLLNEDVPLAVDLILRFAADVASGLSYIHNLEGIENVTHGDLKPDNILLNENLICKIADFGSAKLTKYASTTTGSGDQDYHKFTTIYAAPERLKWERSAMKKHSDTYSFGMVLHMMLSRSMPFQNNIDFAQAVKDGQRPATNQIDELKSRSSESCKSMITVMENEMRRCWKQDQKQRPDMISVRENLQTALRNVKNTKMLKFVQDALEFIVIRNLPSDHLSCDKYMPLTKFSKERGQITSSSTVETNETDPYTSVSCSDFHYDECQQHEEETTPKKEMMPSSVNVSQQAASKREKRRPMTPPHLQPQLRIESSWLRANQHVVRRPQSELLQTEDVLLHQEAPPPPPMPRPWVGEAFFEPLAQPSCGATRPEVPIPLQQPYLAKEPPSIASDERPNDPDYDYIRLSSDFHTPQGQRSGSYFKVKGNPPIKNLPALPLESHYEVPLKVESQVTSKPPNLNAEKRIWETTSHFVRRGSPHNSLRKNRGTSTADDVQPIQYAQALIDFKGKKKCELTFKKGDQIEILNQGGEGKCTGRLNGKQGLVQLAYVKFEEKEVIEEDVGYEHLPYQEAGGDEKKQLRRAVTEIRYITHDSSKHQNVVRTRQVPTALPKYKALFSYDVGGPSEIAFEVNDIIEIVKEYPSGWWIGRLPNGREGFVHSSYVKKI